MGIYAQNDDANPDHWVRVSLVEESVDGHYIDYMSATRVIIPPRTAPGQFHIIWLWSNGDDKGLVALPQGTRPSGLPSGSSVRPICAWGTEPRRTILAKQQQLGNIVQFTGDCDYDEEYGATVEGDGVWHHRPNCGGWPKDLCRAIYVRAETGRKTDQGAGMAQMNFSSRYTVGSDQNPSMSFRAQVKGYSSPGNRDAVADQLRVVIDPAMNGVGVMINDKCIGAYLSSGYELNI